MLCRAFEDRDNEEDYVAGSLIEQKGELCQTGEKAQCLGVPTPCLLRFAVLMVRTTAPAVA